MERLEYIISIFSDKGERKVYLIVNENRNIHIFSITKDGALTIKSKEDLGALADVVGMGFLHSIFRSMWKHISYQNLWNGTHVFSCNQPSLKEKSSDTLIELIDTNLQKAILQE